MCKPRASSHTFTDIIAPAPLQRQLFAMHPHGPPALTAPSRHRLPSLVPQPISAPNRTIEPFSVIRAFIAPARRNQKLVAPLDLIATKAVCSPRFVRAVARTARRSRARRSSVPPAAAARSLMNELMSAISFSTAQWHQNFKFLVLQASFVPSLISPLQFPVPKDSFALQTPLSHQPVLSAAFVQQTPRLPRLARTISTPQQASERVSL
jgi:hypothetical protein